MHRPTPSLKLNIHIGNSVKYIYYFLDLVLHILHNQPRMGCNLFWYTPYESPNLTNHNSRKSGYLTERRKETTPYFIDILIKYYRK